MVKLPHTMLLAPACSLEAFGSNVSLLFHVPWLPSSPVVSQCMPACLFCRMRLPGNVEAQHSIYDNLEDAYLRMLLPSKAGTFPVLHSDTNFISDVLEALRLPDCVGLGQVQLLKAPNCLLACTFVRSTLGVLRATLRECGAGDRCSAAVRSSCVDAR